MTYEYEHDLIEVLRAQEAALIQEWRGVHPIPAFHKDGTPLLSGRKGLGGQWMVGRRSLKGGAA